MARNESAPIMPLVDQNQTNLQNNILEENWFINHYGNNNNNNLNNPHYHYSTAPSLESLMEAEFLHLRLSSSSAAISNDDGLQYPFLGPNDVSTIPHGESSKMQSQAVAIGEEYIPIGPRNGDGYQHGRGISGMMMNEVDYEGLKEIIEGGDLREIKKIIELIKDCVHEVMVDQFGSQLVQSLFAICDENSINCLLLSLTKNQDLFLAVCLHNRGHKALMKLLDCLRHPQQQSTIVLAISFHCVTLAKWLNGHNVLKSCFLNFSPQANELILLRIAQSSWELARDRAGCCILQNCIQYAIEDVREALVTPLIQDVENLSKHPYGNYVIQSIIKCDGANSGTRIVQDLKNKFVGLSLDKFGSHVVEHCLSFCRDEIDNIIFEIIDNGENWVHISTHQYGNYVAQKILSVAKEEVLKLLARVTKSNWLVLRFNPYGKKVIDAAKSVQKKLKTHE